LALAATLMIGVAQASANGGGVAAPGAKIADTGKPGKAKLLKSGKAIPPSNAPARVRRAIAAANRIRKRPYVYGGGHASFNSRGYDCSGAVSYALHAAGMLKSPMPSGPLMSWGQRGRGRWITVYANGGHAYAVIAGLRWDTSSGGDSRSQGSGPRWRYTKRVPGGYARRHFGKL
jgi:hypothetical protein